jgi:hypothetical protein
VDGSRGITGNREEQGVARRAASLCVPHGSGVDHLTSAWPAGAKRARRGRPSGSPRTPAEIERFNRREAACLQRAAWKQDRWLPGATVTLEEREDIFQADMASLGFETVSF